MRQLLNTVRMMPFLLTGLYVPYIVASACGDGVWFMATQICFVSPLACLVVYLIGRPLNFCIWWQLQCFVPMLPTVAAVCLHYGGERYTGMCVAALVAVFAGTIINGIKILTEYKARQ